MSTLNVARVALALVALALAWWLGWVAAAAAILPPVLLAERLLYVAWKEARA